MRGSLMALGLALLLPHAAASAQDATLLHGGDPWVADRRGVAVACSADGSRVVVGSCYAGVRLFVRVGAEWRLEHEARGEGDGLGTSVAMSADGSVVAIGATLHGGSGAVRILVRDTDGWRSDALVVPSHRARNDRFGASVALSGDGGTLLVGAPSDDRAGRGAGSVHVLVRRGADWIETTTLELGTPSPGDTAGISVALSYDGSVALVGVRGLDVEGARNGGGAWIVTLDESGRQLASTLPEVRRTPGAALGSSVALSADGTVVVLGAPRAWVDALGTVGGAYVLERQDARWELRATFHGSVPGQAFGQSVTIASNGRTALVGAPGADPSARVLVRTQDGWSVAGALGPRPGAGEGSRFGTAVALSADGQLAIVGAPGTTIDTLREAGVAYASTTTDLPPGSTVWSLDAPLDASARADLAAAYPSRDGDRQIREIGSGTMIVGALGVVAGGVMMIGGATAGSECVPTFLFSSCTYRPDQGLVFGGGATLGIGAALLVLGGAIFSQRQQGPRHPGVVLFASPDRIAVGLSLTF